MPKIISECCELVKLYHVNDSSPVYLRDTVDTHTHTFQVEPS